VYCRPLGHYTGGQLTVSRLRAELSSQNVETPGTGILPASGHGWEAMAKACALGAFGVRPRSHAPAGAWRSCRLTLRQLAGGRNVAPTLRSALEPEASFRFVARRCVLFNAPPRLRWGVNILILSGEPPIDDTEKCRRTDERVGKAQRRRRFGRAVAYLKARGEAAALLFANSLAAGM